MQNSCNDCKHPLLVPADKLLKGFDCAILGQSDQFPLIFLTSGQNPERGIAWADAATSFGTLGMRFWLHPDWTRKIA